MKTNQLNEILNHIENDEAILISSGIVTQRNHDVDYPFRPQSQFQYICTLQENNCILAIEKIANKPQVTLLKKDNDPVKARWTGERLSIKNALNLPGIDHALPLTELTNFTQSLAHRAKNIHSLPNDRIINELSSITTDQSQLDKIFGQCRLCKNNDEIQLIKKAIELTGHGHINAMRMAMPGCNEAQLALYLQQHASSEGIQTWAYPPIIAGGERACILHYDTNNATINDGELVLIDAGFEYNGYASDITRTFPANGTFSPEQRALYECVYHTQQTTISAIRPGITFPELNQVAKETMLKYLLDIGFLTGSYEYHIERQSLNEYFYHGIGHWLGLDVHDPCPYQMNNTPTLFSNGMVFTIEPGIYVNPQSHPDPKWWGIGIRIEDNIVIHEDQALNLSHHIPSQIEEVEKLCQKLL